MHTKLTERRPEERATAGPPTTGWACLLLESVSRRRPLSKMTAFAYFIALVSALAVAVVSIEATVQARQQSERSDRARAMLAKLEEVDAAGGRLTSILEQLLLEPVDAAQTERLRRLRDRVGSCGQAIGGSLGAACLRTLVQEAKREAQALWVERRAAENSAFRRLLSLAIGASLIALLLLSFGVYLLRHKSGRAWRVAQVFSAPPDDSQARGR